MTQENNLKIIEALSNAKGASGFEDDVLLHLREFGKNLGTFTEDKMRNLYLSRKENTGKKPVVQLDAHTDEVGLMVQYIRPNGSIQFVPLGGWAPSSLPSTRMMVRTAKGNYIPGIVASKPPHYIGEAERKAAPLLEQMVIDVGASSRDEAIKDFCLRVGEPIVPDACFEYQAEHDLLIGKAFDCRLGCAAMAITLQEIAGKKLPLDVIGAYATQEEVGLRGAKLTARTVKPDIAIVFEGCPADDIAVESFASQAALKKGPMLRHIDSTMITNPRYQRFALNLAEELGIPVQAGVRNGGGTNGGAFASEGIPVIVLCIPVRYIHTHYGIATLHDVNATVKLAVAVLESLTSERIASF